MEVDRRQQGLATYADQAFRFYRERYDHWRRFDRPLKPHQRAGLPLMALLRQAARRPRARYLEGVQARMAADLGQGGPLAIAFSRNQALVADRCGELGIVSRVLQVGVEPPTRPSGEYRSARVSEGELLLLAASDGRRARELVNAVESDAVLSRNGVRVIKMTAILDVLGGLDRLDPTSVVLFNDHEPYSTLTFDWCRRHALPTIYLQHAPVNDLFPALHHDLNILFSQQSVEAYDVPTSDSVEVTTLFDIRMLPGLETEPPTGRADVLLCSNPLDPVGPVEDTLRALAEDGPVVHRPHPRDRRAWNKIDGVRVSPGGSIWTDLQSARAVVGNETAVVLEALVAGRPYYKASWWGQRLDNYGFLEKGLLVREYDSGKDLVEAVREGDDPTDPGRLDYFVGPFRDAGAREARLADVRTRIKRLGGEIP